MKKMNIGFIGNFIPEHSTENDRRWTLARMGHNVYAFQENKTTSGPLLGYMNKLDMLLYSHTHDPEYAIKDLIKVFKAYKEYGVPTVSIHLDKWAGLEREKDVGVEATWFTEYIFMADCSPPARRLYDKHKLNYFYLKPGVVERDCYIAHADPVRFPHDIVFTGSKGYHKEYPFRAEMIDFLTKEYGDNFGHYGNDGIEVVRGHDLNTLYASAKIVVGDACFVGQDDYVSDRYYEVRGRGGFLIHPEVKGVDKVGVGFYKPQDLKSLKKMIDSYLENPGLRKAQRVFGFNRVLNSDTYTDRFREMFEIIDEERKD